MVMNVISKIDFKQIEIPEQVTSVIISSAEKFFNFLTKYITTLLTNIIQSLTKLPIVFVNIVITVLATYFICTEKFYILDKLEHHVPKPWIKKANIKIKKITSTLGKYLKAEVIMICITFIIVLIGMYMFRFIGFNITYPLLLALAIGFVDALPILGAGTVLIPWSIIEAINGDLKFGIALILLYAITILTKQLLEPKIVSSEIGIHPIFTLIAMYTGVRFMGILGLLVGPIVLIILKNVYSNLLKEGIIKSIFDQ